MFSDPVSFNGDTRVEVITVLANCGMDTDRARRALVTWIRHKQDKGRSTEHILTKLRDIESKFIQDATLHSAFRDARAETFLPRVPGLPLPSHLRRKSNGQSPECLSSVITPNSVGIVELPADLTHHASPPISPLRLSRGSSQTSELFAAKAGTRKRMSFSQGILRVTRSHTPQIQIPRDRSLPGPSSPVTSSPEESEFHYRYRYMSRPVGQSSHQSNGLVTPVSPSPPELPLSPISSRDPVLSRSYGFVPALSSARVSIPRSLSQRSAPRSPPTPSSDESDFHSRRYRSVSQSVPPKAFPPDVPLPSIPSGDDGLNSDGNNSQKSPRAEPPPTPVRTLPSYPSTPMRPLPIQPIPSPVPGSDESEPSDLIDVNSLRQNWQEPYGDFASDIIVREDSPIYMFRDDHATPTGIGPPPPYIDRFGTYFPTDIPTIGDSLDRAVKEHGGSSEVRCMITKCIEFHTGYEPPYWQSRLQACGLDAEAAGHLVTEMCKQVDWTSTSRRVN